jgi:hypothetical protein
MADDDLSHVAVSDLRQALGRVLDAVERRFGASIDLEADLYWSLNAVDSFDLRTEPSVMAGQISEDVETLRELLSSEREEVYIWHDLDHLCGILQRISALDSPRQGDSD